MIDSIEIDQSCLHLIKLATQRSGRHIVLKLHNQQINSSYPFTIAFLS